MCIRDSSSIEQFANYMKSQNLKKNDTFVLYDDFGIIGACRVWWTMKIFGVQNVYVLNGSSIKWKNEKLPLETTSPKPITPAKELEKFEKNSSLVIDINEVKQISKQIQSGIKGFEIVDARGPGRFNGTEPEPRPGLRSGNIPGSKNVFFKDTLNQDWSFKNEKQLKELFEGKGIKMKNTKIVNTCGSGMTASVLNFAEELIGVKSKAIYDGSWTEFGSLPL
eukprot:TRINITY_DN1507_c0_g1_i6.p1 TRINITY_DN1507_c0_g1~~TRINITY_DN1507_c0_g1_i6.p1  ORF type:complete len:222 (-),score=21.35 TRINITY_DN1507_c0_g1_i6:125-790(-)